MLVEAGSCAGSDHRSIAAVVARVLDDDGGERWCNLTLEVDEDAPGGTPDSVLFSFLAARGPSSPLATIASGVGKRADDVQLGLQHRAGQKAALQLREAGLEIPEGWTWVQDHPRRGLVIDLPSRVGAAAVVGWLLPVMHHLNRAPITGTVLYEVFESG